MTTTAAYVRVSTTDQTSDPQVEAINKYCIYRGIAEYELFSDQASGKDFDRPEWEKLWTKVLNGEIKTLIVWSVDRLGRNEAELIKALAYLADNKINLISIQENLDLSTPAGQMVASIMAIVASFERKRIKERIKAGIASARAKGKKWGGNHGRCKKSQDRVNLMMQLKKAGWTDQQIGEQYNISKQAVNKLLKWKPKERANQCL